MIGSDKTDAPRPSPEALLKAADGAASRGRLKIFLGAAPGVGKTYEMLSQGRQRRLEGVDTVIGVVETHGRVETDQLTKGFEIVAKKRVPYRGQALQEMDLDAILQRRPRLVLVDELAHTNAPGSRHPKRTMDVEELLAAGIDVYTTLNVQHIESLNDVVARITRIRVRETVPDSIVDRADEVELIDISPENLIQRLKEGKVYVPAQAERAVRHYFLPGNLTALRELALRRTADRVDDQMVDYIRAHAIQGPWEASERVLVGIDEQARAAGLIRYAKRLADRLHAPWSAIHIETSRTQRLGETERRQLAENLRLAERLGGMAITIPAADVAAGLVDYAAENNFSHLVVARARPAGWRALLRSGVADRVIRQTGDISVHVILGRPADGGPVSEPQRLNTRPDVRRRVAPAAYLGALAMVAVALGAAFLLRQFLAVSNLALVFLPAVLAAALSFGLLPSLFACLVAVLAFNFFFLPPLYTFSIAAPENVFALFFFALVAIIASNLTARVRWQAMLARQRAKATEELYVFARKLAAVTTLDDVLWATAYQVALMLKVRVVLLTPQAGMLGVSAGYPPEDTLDAADLAAAKWAFENAKAAGRGADTLPGAKRLFLPMQTGRGAVGVIGLDSDDPGPILTPDRQRLLDALSDQAALAIERVNLAADIDAARLASETEHLRSALLTSISHDLRTPLTSILGSATALRTYRDTLDAAAADELIATIEEETERLNRFIANLLDMTKLESGALAPRAERVELGDLVASALERARSILAAHRVETDLAPDLPMASLDPVLFEQVLFNLLDNAAKYSPEGTLIRIEGRAHGSAIRLSIADEGNGIPPEDLRRIFDKFYRVHSADRKRAGTGLGLAICRGFVEAMGGTIVAGNRADRSGAVFTIGLPAAAAQQPRRA